MQGAEIDCGASDAMPESPRNFYKAFRELQSAPHVSVLGSLP